MGCACVTKLCGRGRGVGAMYNMTHVLMYTCFCRSLHLLLMLHSYVIEKCELNLLVMGPTLANICTS